MFRFVKKCFCTAVIFSCSVLNVISLKCVSMNNQECRIRAERKNANSNEPTFYPYSFKINKCSGSCNNINDPYAKLCVPDIFKNINVKVVNIMSRTSETRHIDRHVCNNKQR